MATMQDPGRFRRTIPALLGIAIAMGPVLGVVDPAAGPGGASVLAADLPIECPTRRVVDGSDRRVLRRADALLHDRYRLGDHPEVTLPHDLTWREDPLHDANWLVRFHGLSWVRTLLDAWRISGRQRYAGRATAVIHDWLADNPRSAPRSGWSWYDQSTGIRASTIACAAAMLGMTGPMRDGLAVHGRLLASPGFYVGVGNHALDQDIGLMDAAHALGRADWLAIAARRVGTLVVRSVSEAGVTNEQSVGYQRYNYQRYAAMRDRLRAYGAGVPAAFDRIDRMPAFLGWATLPDATYDTIGDTNRDAAWAIPGTIAEYAATGGAAGPHPGSSVRLYRHDGWLFARTGWGEERPLAEEVAWSLRFGPSPYIHGHADGGSITLWGDGARQVVDPGKFTYTAGRWHDWFQGREAHNVVVADGLPDAGASTRLVAWHENGSRIDVTVATTQGTGTTIVRRVLFSRGGGWLLVEDRARSSAVRTWRQRWHLPEDAHPVAAGRQVTTAHPGGDLLIRSLTGGDVQLVRGGSSPIEGWVSWRYGERVAAPVAEVVRRGTAARWLTLLVTGPETPDATVSGVELTADGYRLTIATRGRTESVVVTADGSSVTTVEPSPAP